LILNVTDSFGKELPYRVASFVDRDNGSDLTVQCVVLKCHGLPFGVYRYRLERMDYPEGAAKLSGEIRVFSTSLRDTIVTSGTVVMSGGQPGSITFRKPQDFRILGSLRPIPEGRAPVWIRFQGLYSNFHVDVDVDGSGAFRIVDSLQGVYTATVIRGGEILGLKLVRFEQNLSSASFRLELSEQTPDVIVVRGDDRRR
jgi:hypothetical protein